MFSLELVQGSLGRQPISNEIFEVGSQIGG